MLTAFQTRLEGIVDLGGPVVALLMVLSVIALAVILWKLWQFGAVGVGRHPRLSRAMAALDAGDRAEARRLLGESRSFLAPILARALDRDVSQSRIEAEASDGLERLEKGLRILDSIAQIAPLLGLFGTVLGMIDAFRGLQDAGSSVDPSTLAGGIWVALMTTAAGLAVSMPTSLILTFFESRVAKERALAELAVETIFHPMPVRAERAPAADGFVQAHAG